MQNYSINRIDRAILNFIASEESRGNYDAVYPGDALRPEILEYTITQILKMQDEMAASAVAKYSRNTATGRYQLIKDQVSKAAGYIGVNKDLTKFTKGIQDAFCMEILKKDCKYNEWVAKQIETPEFQTLLAGQFESIPVPCKNNNSTKRLGKVGSLEAGHDCDTCEDTLENIRNKDPGASGIVPIQLNTDSGVTPKQGTTLGRIAETATVGVPFTGGHPGIKQDVVTLPSVDNPYFYEPIDPFDDRYDFRTGRKVVDIGINGVTPANASSVPPLENATDTPGVQDSGTVPPGAGRSGFATGGTTVPPGAGRSGFATGGTTVSPGAGRAGFATGGTTSKPLPTPTSGPQ